MISNLAQLFILTSCIFLTSLLDGADKKIANSPKFAENVSSFEICVHYFIQFIIQIFFILIRIKIKKIIQLTQII